MKRLFCSVVLFLAAKASAITLEQLEIGAAAFGTGAGNLSKMPEASQTDAMLFLGFYQGFFCGMASASLRAEFSDAKKEGAEFQLYNAPAWMQDPEKVGASISAFIKKNKPRGCDSKKVNANTLMLAWFLLESENSTGAEKVVGKGFLKDAFNRIDEIALPKK